MLICPALHLACLHRACLHFVHPGLWPNRLQRWSVGLLALPFSALAATTASQVLAPVTVTAKRAVAPLPTRPVLDLKGGALMQHRQPTLGALLNQQPGVTATGYGPWVSRPLVRGLGGDHIDLSQNGLGVFDASALSHDHAVPADVLSIDRLEVVRGPAALRYGSGVGGVVQTTDARIPVRPQPDPEGRLTLDHNSANDGHAVGLRLDAGTAIDPTRAVAVHVDGFYRHSGLQSIPGHSHSAHLRQLMAAGAHQDVVGKLPNSNGQAQGGAVGASWFTPKGRIGLAQSRYTSAYGSVAEPDVRLQLEQDKTAVQGNWDTSELTGGFLEDLQLDGARTVYAHDEIENGVPGTHFDHRGTEVRLEGQHRALKSGAHTGGVLGVQASDSTFAASGDEALVPGTRTKKAALFALENFRVGPHWTISGAGRLERARLNPAQDAGGRFGWLPARDFTALSGALGAVRRLGATDSLRLNLGRSERAPTFYELYANGPHVATGQYLVGNPALKTEAAWALDLAWVRHAVQTQASVGVFFNRFDRYLGEFGSGRQRTPDGQVVTAATPEAMPEAVYRAVPVNVHGFEAQVQHHVAALSRGHLGVDGRADWTNGRLRGSSDPLPRLPPLRLGSGLSWSEHPVTARAFAQGWQTRLELQHAFAQRRVPQDELPTRAHTVLNAHASLPLDARARTPILLTLRGSNLTNAEIRHATSVVRDVAPDAGRSVQLGVQVDF